MRLPIRARLTVWYLAVLTAIIAALGAFVVLQFRADMRATIDRDVRHTWRPLARQYAAGGLRTSPRTAARCCRATARTRFRLRRTAAGHLG